MGVPYNELLKFVGDSWGSDVSINASLEFLYETIQILFKEKLRTKWTTYKVTIGDVGDTITPFSLLDVTRVRSQRPQVTGKALEQDQVLGRVAEILSIYSAYTASQGPGNDQMRVLGRMKTILTDSPYNLKSMDTSSILAKVSWGSNGNFKKIVAAVDMFFNKFPESVYAKIKVTTLSSRDRDCGGLHAIQDLSKYIGKPTSVALSYAMDPRIGPEIIRLTTENDEATDSNSYFHYMRDMGLSQKSPYSSSINPVIYNFTYALGTFLGDTRACNARKFSDKGITNTINVAAYVAYYLKQWGIPEVKRKVDERDKMFSEEGKDDEEKNILFILKQIKANGGIITEEIRRDLQKGLSKLTGLRTGTIGHYVSISF